MNDRLGTAALSALLTLAVAPVVLVGVRRLRLLDMPCERSSHGRPVPRGGGLAPALGALVGLLAVDVSGTPRTSLLVATVSFATIGLIDDVWGAPALHRLGFQLVAACVALVWLLDGMGGDGLWRLVFTAGCVLWLVGYVNAFNFMDGINGISAAQAVVAGATWVVIGNGEGADHLAAAGAIVAASALAFVPFNLGRPVMFLGDVGSYFFGAWLAAAAVLGLRAGIPAEAVLAPLALYIADTSTTLFRRVRDHHVWYEAHRSHIYQQLVLLGWSHARTTAIVATVQVACAGLGALALSGELGVRLAADVMLTGVLGLYLAAPRLVSRRVMGAATAAPTRAAL